MENLPLFSAAVISANIAGLSTSTVNFVCGLFLAFRVMHTVAYIGIEDRKYMQVRSPFWAGGVGCCLYLLIKAANVLVDGRGIRPVTL